MKRIRLIPALVLCLALICLSTSALAASKAATTKPTVKITAPKSAVRGGIGGDITITPSVPGFLTLKLLSEDGVELRTICENQEVHTKANTIEFDARDAEGNYLAEGTYQLSAMIVNQYGNESKTMTAKLKVGAPRPTLSNITVSASKAFMPSVSFDAAFDTESNKKETASIDLSVYRTQPKPAFVDDFATVEIKAPESGSTKTMNLADGIDLPSAAGYYTLKGTISEYISGIASETIEAEFVVDTDGSVYMLAEASEDVIASVDQYVADVTAAIENNSLDQITVKKNVAAQTEAPQTDSAKADTTSEKAVSETNASQTDSLSYAQGEHEVGEEGLAIGVGVSDSAGQTDAGYWTLTSDATDEEIWQAITRTMISVNVAEQESSYIYDSTEDGRKSIGTVSGLTQGLNVIKEREDGWSLVEAYRNEDGAFVRGYIRTNRLRVVEPNTTYGLVIDKSTQTLTVWKDGAAIGSCAVTTGLPTEKYLHRETPAGEYILATRRGTIEYYGSNGYSKYTIRLSGNYHLCEIPTTKKNGSDFSLLEGSLGQKATRGHICVAHEASSDGGINAEWIWEMTDSNKRVKVLILDDKARSEVPVGE